MSRNQVLKRQARKDSADAFLPTPESGTFERPHDAESFGTEFIASATSAGFVLEDARNELSMDEVGGPFVEDDLPPVSAWLLADESGETEEEED